jgi:uncharacterized protein with ATP-grasp and redox domains
MKLARQASNLSTSDGVMAEGAYRAALGALDRLYHPGEISIVIASEMHQAIRDVSHNPDPYFFMKQKEIEIARTLAPVSAARNGDSLSGLVRNAAQGNAIDYFRSLDEISEDLRRDLLFAIDDTARLSERLAVASDIVYLADNAGEAYFDLPFYRYLKNFGRVTYVVKGSPIQNDITLEDLEATGLREQFVNIITTGTATPGIDLRLASSQFIDALGSADLVIAKGMGYYESLTEYNLRAPVFYCLKAKCGPVARSLSVPVGSYISKLDVTV